MTSEPGENGPTSPMPRLTIDDSLYATLSAALDCFRSRTLDNIDTSVSDDERQYFEQVLGEIDRASVMLDGEEHRDDPGLIRQVAERHGRMDAVVLELQRSDYRDLSMANALQLGKALAAIPETIGVWIAEDGNSALRGVARLQFAATGKTAKDAAESVWPSISILQKQFGRPLAIAYFDVARPDVVPQLVAEQLGIDVTPNQAKLVRMLKEPQRL